MDGEPKTGMEVLLKQMASYTVNANKELSSTIEVEVETTEDVCEYGYDAKRIFIPKGTKIKLRITPTS